jgi:uncharacterized damage-inducible protein DinB
MEAALDRLFLDYSIENLRQRASEIERCLAKLTDGQIWARGGENENAIGNLLLHVCGNVRQRIAFGIEGRPDVRERDREFSARAGASVPELTDKLRATVDEATAALGGVTAEMLSRRVKVQGFDQTMLEMIYHMVEHFALHTGQIIFATKVMTGEDLGFFRPPTAAAATEQRSA